MASEHLQQVALARVAQVQNQSEALVAALQNYLRDAAV